MGPIRFLNSSSIYKDSKPKRPKKKKKKRTEHTPATDLHSLKALRTYWWCSVFHFSLLTADCTYLTLMNLFQNKQAFRFSINCLPTKQLLVTNDLTILLQPNLTFLFHTIYHSLLYYYFFAVITLRSRSGQLGTNFKLSVAVPFEDVPTFKH